MQSIDLRDSCRHSLIGSIRLRLPQVIGLFALVLAGCGQSHPEAASQLSLMPEESNQGQEGVLNGARQAKIASSFRSLAAGYRATRITWSAPDGMRWSDVDAAVVFACDDAEMAVVDWTNTPESWTYRLKTTDDEPGTLIVTRAGGHATYEAHASIGLYGQRNEDAQRLLEALRKKMLAFGKKRSLAAD